MDHLAVQKQIENYLLKEFAFDRNEIGPEEDLLNQGILDSIGILQLASFLETTFNIEVDDNDIVIEHFRCLNTLAELVSQKSKKNGIPS